MKTSKKSIENEIISINADIAKCESMTESEMQQYFNTDNTKEEFMQVLKDELSFYEKESNENEDDEYSPSEVDCGFANMQDFISYKYY